LGRLVSSKELVLGFSGIAAKEDYNNKQMSIIVGIILTHHHDSRSWLDVSLVHAFLWGLFDDFKTQSRGIGLSFVVSTITINSHIVVVINTAKRLAIKSESERVGHRSR